MQLASRDSKSPAVFEGSASHIWMGLGSFAARFSVVLATAMQQGVTPLRAKRLRELIGVSYQTLARWRAWWATTFVESVFWKGAKAAFSSPADEGGFPLSLLVRFGPDKEARLVALLRFIRELSTPGGYVPDQRL